MWKAAGSRSDPLRRRTRAEWAPSVTSSSGPIQCSLFKPCRAVNNKAVAMMPASAPAFRVSTHEAHLYSNHWQSCCVGAAAQLELADVLADGPLHVTFLPGAARHMDRA